MLNNIVHEMLSLIMKISGFCLFRISVALRILLVDDDCNN